MAYPRVKDKDDVHYNSSNDVKLVLLTPEKMKNNFMEVIEQEANAQAIQPDKLHLDCYMTLAKVMYASQRAEKVKKCKGNIGFHLAGPEDLVDKVQRKLV